MSWLDAPRGSSRYAHHHSCPHLNSWMPYYGVPRSCNVGLELMQLIEHSSNRCLRRQHSRADNAVSKVENPREHDATAIHGDPPARRQELSHLSRFSVLMGAIAGFQTVRDK